MIIIKRHLSVSLVLILCVAHDLKLAVAYAQEKQSAPIITNAPGSYLKECAGVISKKNGLCLLTSIAPKSKTVWMIRSKDRSVTIGGLPAMPVIANRFMPVNPGDYFLYSKDGFDNGGHELPFTVINGQVTTLKTAAFRAAGHKFVIRHFQGSSGINGAGCVMRTLDSNITDVLPGNYLVYMDSVNVHAIPCPPGGVASNALSGRTQNVGVRNYVNQTIPTSGLYKHPNGVSSLTSISQFRDDIEQIGVLSRWDSLNGIKNPYPIKYSALVLLGLGTRTYIIPFKKSVNRAVCGRSLPLGGLAALPLLTDCRFFRGKLVDFKVMSGGSYFSINNRHGEPAFEGNNINNSILVKGLASEIP